MKNLKIIKSLSIILVIALFTGIIPNKFVNAKTIYFAGEYEHSKWSLSLIMNQYSSPEGKEVGNFELSPGAHVYLSVSGTLSTVKNNVYRYKEGKAVFTFKVYKNKVKIKMNKYAKKNYYNYTGTYKLKQHFYS